MVDANVLRRRLDSLLQYLDRLARFRDTDREEFKANADVHHLAERYLHLAVESALDIANHVIADRNWEAPATYRDAFSILGRNGFLDERLASRLQQWAGFRNVLVHAYLDADHGIAWDAIQTDLGELRALAERAATLL